MVAYPEAALALQAAARSDGAPTWLLVLLALIFVVGAGRFAWVRLRSRRPGDEAVADPRPVAAVAPPPRADSRPAARRERPAESWDSWRAGADPPAPAAAVPEPGPGWPPEPQGAWTAPRPGWPPEPQGAWTAEIEWRAGETPRFCAVATPAEGTGASVLVESPPLAWPPTDDRSVRALAEAAQRLEAVLLTAGWKPLPAGAAWYAKRFAWAPVATGHPAPEASPPGQLPAAR